jgi:hypothetical protein
VILQHFADKILLRNFFGEKNQIYDSPYLCHASVYGRF